MTRSSAGSEEQDRRSPGSSTILDKAFAILMAFSADGRVLSLAEITQISGLPKSTVHRVLARLVAHGAVERHGDGYKLGLNLMQFGATSPAGLLRDVSLPYLSELRRWSGQRVELAVLRADSVVCLERVDAVSPVSLNVGLRRPAHTSAAGQVIMAFSGEPVPDGVLEAVMASEPDGGADRFMALLHSIKSSGIARTRAPHGQGALELAAPIVPLNRANAALSFVVDDEGHLPPRADLALRDATARIAAELRAHLTGAERGRWLPPDP